MDTTGKPWEDFEDVFRAILDYHKDFFGLEEVEPGPMKVTGKARKVRPWNIEVVGYRKGTRRLILFECKLQSRNVEPDVAGGFAYRIEDTGAETGYFVTPLEKGLAKGAQEITDYEQIGHIQLFKYSTPDDYVMRCADYIFAGISDEVKVTESLTFDIHRKNAHKIEREL